MKGRLGSGLRTAAAAIWLASCSPAPGASEEETAAPGVSDETLYALEGETPENEEVVSFAVPVEELITAESVGVIRPGDTLSALQSAYGDARIRVEPRYTPELAAVCVDDPSGVELFCAAYAASEQPAADTRVVMISTRHPRFRTREGVGPGVALEDAEIVYGDAFLSYNGAAEGREYVEFDHGPAGSISFRPLTPSNPGGLAGVYASPGPGFNETEDYQPDAVIGTVEVRAAAHE
jgi:hypothetical protein